MSNKPERTIEEILNDGLESSSSDEDGVGARTAPTTNTAAQVSSPSLNRT